MATTAKNSSMGRRHIVAAALLLSPYVEGRHWNHASSRHLQGEAFIPEGYQQSEQPMGVSTYPADANVWMNDGSLWIAGTRFATDDLPSCFVSRIAFNDPWSMEDTEYLVAPSWEACTSLSLGLSPEGGGAGKAIVAGFSQRPALVGNGTSPYRSFTIDAYPAFGAAPLPLLDNTIATSDLNAVTVPVASVSRGDILSAEGETTWILTMDLPITQEIADDIVTGRSEPFRSAVANSMSIHRWIGKTMQQEGLQRTFAGTWNNMPVNIQPAGILSFQSGRLVIVAGSTYAQGSIFGPKRFGNGNDLDGFVLKLDGDQVQPWASTEGDIASSHVFESVNEQEDRIEAICGNEAADPDHFFVLGSTMGSIDGSTDPILLSKVNVRTLERAWTVRLAVNGSVRGKSCSVSNDGDDVYFSGVLFDGAVLTSFGPATAYGGHDIFVAKAFALSGELAWAKQMGSGGNDVVSAIVPTPNDDGAVVVAQSNGEWYRQKTESNVDLVLTSVSRQDGNHLTVLGTSDSIANPVAAPVATPVAAPAMIMAPVAAPFTVASPVAVPVAAPFTFVAAPVAAPFTVSSPVLAPVAAPFTVAAPVAAPLSTPIASPVSAPIMAPVSVGSNASSTAPTVNGTMTESPSVMTSTGVNQTENPTSAPAENVIDTVGAGRTSSAKSQHFVKMPVALVTVVLMVALFV